MTNYTLIDWNETMPDAAAVAAGLRDCTVTHVDVDAALLAVVDLIHRDWVNGRALAAQFQLELDPHIAFFANRNRLHDIPFFPFLFAAPIGTEVEPLSSYLDLFGPAPWGEGRDDIARTFDFRLDSSWVSLAHLAAWIAEGGTYSAPAVPDADIAKMTSDIADAAFGGRYGAALSYRSAFPWCGWFRGDVRDGSWFWLDLETGLAMVLLITDGP